MNILRKVKNLEDTISLSRELSSKIAKEFNPDYVVYISQSGILPGFEISKELNVPLRSMKIRRKHNFYLFVACKDRIPVFERGPHRKIEYNKKILVVDDTVRTGRTINMAKSYLRKYNPAELKTASLNYTEKTMPDFFMAKGRIKFPWESSHKEHRVYLSYLQDIINNSDINIEKTEDPCSCAGLLLKAYLNLR